MIICEMYLCIYQRRGLCTLNNASINIYGMCEKAVLVDLDEEDLNYYKVRLLEKWLP